jgi:hypothetical protein
MVCFTAHVFKFNNTNAQNWFNLLSKYYEDVDVTVITDNIHTSKGKISMNFFQNTLVHGTTYEIKTNRFWAELAAINCMPRYVNDNVNDDVNISRFQQNNYSTEITVAMDAIDSVIQSRLSYGGQEVFLSRDYSVATFDNLMTAFSLIKNTESITRLYISRIDEAMIIVLNDRHTLCISKDGIGDSTLPVFDVDDGFIPNVFDMGLLMDEFNVSFQKWHQEFLETNGDTWDEQII